MTTDFVLLLREVRLHPDSYVQKLTSQFELPSILRIARKDELKKYTSGTPIFDNKYLVLFDSLRAFESNIAHLKFDSMLPVVCLDTAGSVEEAKMVCNQKDLKYYVYYNEFTKKRAVQLIVQNATVNVSDSMCNLIISHTGLDPTRIMIAVNICEQSGYTKSVVERYIDKWTYPEVRKLLQCMFGLHLSAKAKRRVYRYLYNGRFWYPSIRKRMLSEIEQILEVYKAKMEGKLDNQGLLEYIEQEGWNRSQVLFTLDLFEKVSIATIIAVRETVKTASLMEIVCALG